MNYIIPNIHTALYNEGRILHCSSLTQLFLPLSCRLILNYDMAILSNYKYMMTEVVSILKYYMARKYYNIIWPSM